MSCNEAAIWWIRNDLRLSDNAALLAACEHGRGVVPVFIWAPDEEGEWSPGAAGRWWLHQSLNRLRESLRSVGSKLVIRKGQTLAELFRIVKTSGARSVHWQCRFEPAIRRRDEEIQRSLRAEGIDADSVAGHVLIDPSALRTKSGSPYRVFTPFWKACLAQIHRPAALCAPTRLTPPSRWPTSTTIEALGLEPRVDWTRGMRGAWEPGENGARRALRRFADEILTDYAEARDRPGEPGTSRLSPHLHFGEISVGEVWNSITGAEQRRDGAGRAGVESFLRELGWREFAHHLLLHFPHTPTQPMREEFAKFPWRRWTKGLHAWQSGRTGLPIVDAGMRELWATGWMHNRVRMIVGSFLVKDLRIPWTEGARWFWDTLVDADLANNTLGWQWIAGCGADAAPYFRVFHPVRQGERFDPEGAYVRQWVPELRGLPSRWIHRPWEAPREVAQLCGVELGRQYPGPIVDHAEARREALAAFSSLKRLPSRESAPACRTRRRKSRAARPSR